ncbi:MAG TPA: cbb3-type cytochrome c oxidase N-terminal domain-containing protein [Saprospiraceae bacterium]|nr:cbb3-type cytochrome c oxidase N-terminal domain-containing protein [Saprospiraceae bacterium]HMP25206.1 cbb3-type cytochrome c oxidase N-terminal domain-containing protein [Saprospiraceae bacterium]
MKHNSLKYSAFTVAILLATSAAYAQDATAGTDPYFYERGFSVALLAVAGVVILGALFALSQLVSMMVKVQQIKIYQEQGMEAYLEEVKKKPAVSFWERMYKRWTNVVPVEKEKAILLNHDYDGIRELDNSLPPWWTAMFYITIAFSAVYMIYFHFGGPGLSSSEQYEKEVARAEEAAQVYLARQANQVDENTVVALTDEQSLSLGKTIWDANCVACHGAYGEGGIGPNMTDEYWIHGGSIQDVFRVIKYGVPEKGMISWKSQLRPGDMQRVASYIMTLQGTNPPNPKEPEGEKWEPQVTKEAEAESDAIGMK